jgi:hypothetical protein
MALSIQACVHSAVKQPLMFGSDTLDMAYVKNEKFGIHGKAPAPSVLDYQLDTLVIDYMQTKISALTSGLGKLIFTSKSKTNWYEIFLTIFILLCTLEHVYVSQIRYLRRHIAKVRS